MLNSFTKQNMLLVMNPDQTATAPHYLAYRLLKHFSRREKKATFAVIGALRVLLLLHQEGQK